MDKFLERNTNYQRPLNRKHLNGITSMKEITKKTPDPGGLTGEFYQTSKKEIVTIVHNSSRELKRMNTSPIHSSALQKTVKE